MEIFGAIFSVKTSKVKKIMEPEPTKKILVWAGISLFAAFVVCERTYACGFSGMVCEPPDAKSCGQSAVIVKWDGKSCGDHHYQCQAQTKCVTGTYTYYWNKFDSSGDTEDIAFGACACNQYCLKPPVNPKYYDTPAVDEKHLAATGEIASAKINLPVLLTWESQLAAGSINSQVQEVATDDEAYRTSTLENLNSDRNLDYYMRNYLPAGGFNWDDYNNRLPQIIRSVEQYGSNPQSYLVEFQNNPDKPSLNFGDDERAKLKKSDSDIIKNGRIIDAPDTGKGMEIFQKLVTKEEFNSIADGKPCFLNSSSTIKWRVRLCCDKIGRACMPSSTWWQFDTSEAPEPMGVTDKTRPVPEPDPDWNGPKALGEDDPGKKVDFCTAGLKWCAAKIEPDKIAFNQGSNLSLAYQLMVSYNEGITLNSLINTAKAGDWWGLITKTASYLNIPGAAPGKQSQCHYLLVNQPTPGSSKTCNAEIVKPHGTLQKTPATEFSNATDQNFNRGFFTKNLQYDWTLRRCFDNSNAGQENCQQNVINEKSPLAGQRFGQTWSFKTGDAVLAPPLLASPPDDQKAVDQNSAIPVGIPPTIAWKPPCGANSFEYELSLVDSKTGAVTPLLTTQKTTAAQITFVKNAPAANATINNEDVKTDIRVDTAYKWRARSCWPSITAGGDDSKICDNKSWTDWFSFRTTGRPPQNIKAVGDNSANIPATFSWDQVPGAKSYILDLAAEQGSHTTKLVTAGNAKQTTIQVSYPDLKPSLVYKWKVKTCADVAGSEDLCGDWSVAYSFGTTTLPAPDGFSSPRHLSILDNYPTSLAWNAVKGAAAYQVTMDYFSKDNSQDCPKSGQLFKSVTTANSYDPPALPIACLGTYTWGVVSCFSPACLKNETGSSTTWRFDIDKGGGKSSGLMVCGLRDDDLSTPWNDRKTCEFGDIFKFLEKLIDFVLFRLSVWLLPILAAITGGLFYTQAGGADVLGKVKTMWKYIGIGYALLFFAWILTTWTLQAFGYHGLWWKIL